MSFIVIYLQVFVLLVAGPVLGESRVSAGRIYIEAAAVKIDNNNIIKLL